MRARWRPQIIEEYGEGASAKLMRMADALEMHDSCVNDGCKRHGHCLPHAQWIEKIQWPEKTARNISQRALPPCLAAIWDEVQFLMRQDENRKDVR